MGALDTYEEALAELDRLITGRDQPRDFLAAYMFALKVAVHFPARPQVWTQLVLLANLTDNHPEALMWQSQAPLACGSTWESQHTTDCERDHALYHLRHGDFTAAREHLAKACNPSDDPNRRIVLNMVDGRIHYAEGNYKAAIRRYDEALRAWGQLATDHINQQWRFNTHRWLLKALVAQQRGTNGKRVQAIWHELQTRMDQHGSADLRLRLDLLMRYGQRGNQIDDFLESPRGQQAIKRLGVERAVRYILRRRRQR